MGDKKKTAEKPAASQAETKDFDQVINQILQDLPQLPYIRPEDIPNIDLYMDQVTTFMEEHLDATRRSADDKVLTKTMINNYAKNKLLPPPVKKKYSREHILILIFIYYFKGVLSLQDIQAMLDPVNQHYFQKQEGLNLTDLYRSLGEPGLAEAEYLQQDISRICEMARSSSSSLPLTDRDDPDFVRFFTVISLLSIDVLTKKHVIEQLIDSYLKQP